MRRVSAELVSSRADIRIGHELAPVSMEPVARYRLHDRAVTALDWRLAPAGSVRVELPPAAKLLAATPDFSCVVAASGDVLVVLMAGREHRVPIPAADSATLLAAGQLVVTAPVVTQETRHGRTYVRKLDHRVFLVDGRIGQILDEATLPVDEASVTAVRHPRDPEVLLVAGEGQDGSRVFRASVVAGRLAVELVLEDVVAAGFHPAGDRLLITPHPSFDDPVSVLAWPSLHPVATISPADVDCADDRFDLTGCFLGEDRVLLRAAEHGLLACSAGLQPYAWIDLAADELGAEDEFELMFGVADDAFAADVWVNASALATVWRVPQQL